MSTTSNGSHASGSEYTTGVTHSGTAGSSGAKTTFVVPNGAPATLYYYCGNHSGMGGKINISADAHTPVVNSVVASAIKSFKNDVQSGGIRDGVIAKDSRFRTDKSKHCYKENIMVKIILEVILLQKYLKSLMNKMVKVLLSLDRQLLVILELHKN